MKIFSWSMIVTVVLGGFVGVAGAPASAVVGGRDATQAYPGMASLTVALSDGRTAWCGASLIHPRFLLTAAHCVSVDEAAPTPVAVRGKTVSARVGATDRTAGVLVRGRQVLLHPDWMWGAPTGTPVSDLALVELEKPARLPLMPLSLIRGRADGDVRILGWGLTEFPPPGPAIVQTILQQRDTAILSAAQCAGGFISAGETCLGGGRDAAGGNDSGGCYGDSGGPALKPLYGSFRNVRSWSSIGITSRGTTEEPSCGGPGVWTDATYGPFQHWIFKTMLNPKAQPCTCPPTLYSADSSRAHRFPKRITA